MTSYERYVFILCLIVFACFTSVFFFLIGSLLRATVKLIRSGIEDEKIQAEYFNAKRKKNRFAWIPGLFSSCLSLVLVLSFVASMVLFFTENRYSKDIPSLKVVKSASMSKKYEGNSYLERNDLDDQIQRFDLIVTYELPDEMELELFDIVVYETENGLVIHRIVGIEEPNEKHPDERHFRLRGDANRYSDTYPVRYSQMRAIYRGERVPFVGNVILFLQAPAGWLCILLILFGQIVTPIVEKKLMREIEARLNATASLNAHSLAPRCKLEPIVLSHMRFSMKLQRKDPTLEASLHCQENAVNLKIQKGSRKK